MKPLGLMPMFLSLSFISILVKILLNFFPDLIIKKREIFLLRHDLENFFGFMKILFLKIIDGSR